MLTETLGERIRRLRKRIGLTQAEVAGRCGVSRRTVNAWEAGRSRPRLCNLRALCDTLSVEESYLLQGDLGEYRSAMQEVLDKLETRLGHGSRSAIESSPTDQESVA